MSGDGMLAVQAAIYAKLNGDSTLLALAAGGVYDSVPENTEYPYITIGDQSAKDLGANTFKGMDITHTIHTWAQGRGKKVAKQIMARIYDLLHECSLTVTGQKVVFVRFDFSDLSLDPDGVTYHGVQRFRILTREG